MATKYLKYAKAGINSILNLRQAPRKPIGMFFPVTYRCNSRCRMCNIWKKPKLGMIKKEMNAIQLEKILATDFFSELKTVSFCGGEPFLRQDLPELVGAFADNCRKLKTIVVPTNGLLKNTVPQTKRILSWIDNRLDLSIGVSIDGIGATHDYGRGVPGAYKHAIATIEGLKKLEKKHKNFHPGFGSVILPWNTDELDDLVELSKRMGLPKPQFWLRVLSSSLFTNIDQNKNLSFSEEKLEKVLDFLKQYKYDRDFYAFYAENLKHVTNGKKRIFPCFWGYSFIYLDIYGRVYPCQYLTKSKYLMGNVKTRDISEIWFSKESDVIRKMARKDKACTHCQVCCKFSENVVENLFPYFKFKAKKAGGLTDLKF